MSTYKKITKNAIANGMGFICEAVIAFCMLPYIIHRLGDSAFGVWTFALSISGTMGILNFGIRPAINKYVAQYNATGEWQKIRDLLQASLFSYAICALLIIIICTFLSLNLANLFNIPEELLSTASTLVFLVGIQMATGLIAVVFGGVISGLQRYEINNGIEIFVMLARTALILIFLDRYPSLMTLAAAHFSMTIIGYIATAVIAYQIAEISPLKLFRKPEKNALLTIFKFSAIVFIISTVGRIIMYIDAPLITALLTATAVTHYAIGSRLVRYLGNMIEVLVNVLAPAISELEAKDKIDTIREIFIFSSKFTSLVVFPVLIFLVLFGKEFFVLWLGKAYLEGYQVMTVLAIGSFFNLPQLSSGAILFGTAKHKLIMYFSIISGILSVLLAIFLTEKLGIVGLAIGLSFPQAILSGIGCPIYISRLINLSWSHWFVNTYIKPLSIAIPYGVVFYFIKKVVVVNTWTMLIVLFGIGEIIFIITALLTIITTKEKKFLLNKIGFGG